MIGWGSCLSQNSSTTTRFTLPLSTLLSSSTPDVSPTWAFHQIKDRMTDTLEEAKAALAKLKDDMTLYYNRKCTPAPEFKAGDMVFLDASDIQTT